MLSDFSAAFHGGKRYALMGKSGIGKTTLFRILMGLEMSDSGSLDFLPENPSFSAVFQEDRLFESSDAVTNICAVTKGLSRSEALKELSLIAPDIDISTPVSSLSGGQRRRVAVLRALLHPSDVLLMDEPFSGLDVLSKERTISHIRDNLRDRLFILSTHDEEDARALGCEIILLQ